MVSKDWDPDVFLVDSVRGAVGKATRWHSQIVDPVEIERYCVAVAPALRPPGPGVVGGVPPTFFCPDPIVLSRRLGLEIEAPFANSLDGGTRWKWNRHVRLGELIRLRAEIVDVVVKQGSEHTGRMVLTTLLVTCRSVDDQLLGECWGTHISYEGRRS